MGTTSLDGKVAVVTGAGRGIGREAAETLADHGARVVVSDVSESTSTDPSRPTSHPSSSTG